MTRGAPTNGCLLHLIYLNHRDEWTERAVVPTKLEFTTTLWYPERQWILSAWDVGKQAERGFAVSRLAFLSGTMRGEQVLTRRLHKLLTEAKTPHRIKASTAIVLAFGDVPGGVRPRSR